MERIRKRYRELPNMRMTQIHRLSHAVWAQRLGVTQKQLEEAIEQTSGQDPVAVRSYLINHKYLEG